MATAFTNQPTPERRGRRSDSTSSQHISRIIVDPKNPNIVFVAAQGALYSKSKERGVYKSIDGGATWKNVLYVDEKTGAAELSMDMTNPRILYAAMWEHGRLPWKVISGGPGSGLYKSTDSGETWEKLKDGLPEELGKMSIAVSRSNPEKVYALIESDSDKEAGGLFVSSNGGKKWSRITNDHRLVQRAWYYIELFIDPKNENTIYVLSASALRSNDAGKTWETLSGTHGDYHDLWINPDNPQQLHHLERRRRRDYFQQRKDLEHAKQHADRAVLSHQRRQPVSVSHLRRAAGQHFRFDCESRAGRRRDYAPRAGRLRQAARVRFSRSILNDAEVCAGRQLSGDDRGARRQSAAPAQTSWPRPFNTLEWTRKI